MKKHSYKTYGICASKIDVTLDSQDAVLEVKFHGGCQGNTRGIEKLVEGMHARDVIKKFRGIDCQRKGTSCPDQLAKALEEAISKKQKV